MMDLDASERPSFLPGDAAHASDPLGRGTTPVLPGRSAIEFGAHLRELCADAASLPGPWGGVAVTCEAAAALLPTVTAVRLGLIAEELVGDALRHAFPDGRGGRVAVAFAVEGGAWRLTVEDSGVGPPAASGDRRDGLRLARDLAGEVGGRLEVSGLVGGTRCTVVGTPRAGPCAAPREAAVLRYLELARPLEPGEGASLAARRSRAARRRLAAGVALGWLTVEEALEETPLRSERAFPLG